MMPAESVSSDFEDDYLAAARRDRDRRRQTPARHLAPTESRLEASTLGARQLAVPGCRIWSDPDQRRSPDEHGIGGMLVEIVDSPTIDQETAEITIRRAYKLWNPRRQGARYPGPYLTLPETLVGQDGIEGVDDHRVILATTQMCEEYIKRRGKSGRIPLVGYDVDLIRHAKTLVDTIMGGVR